MAKKLKFGKIKIYFRDGKVDVIKKKSWDEYEYNGVLFVVKRSGAWVYTYNMMDVTAIIVKVKKK